MMFVPEELQNARIWMLWRLEKAKDRDALTKVPYRANIHNAHLYGSSTDDKTWTTYQKARRVFEHFRNTPDSFSGLAIAISESMNLIFIDVDHCIDPDTGEYDQRAKDVFQLLPDTYKEISQSGTGIHIFTTGTIKRSFKRDIEMYSGKRFCAFTGNCIEPLEITENQDGLDALYQKYGPSTDEIKRAEIKEFHGTPLYTDDEIIERVCRTDLGRALFHDDGWNDIPHNVIHQDTGEVRTVTGYTKDDGAPDHSRADIALCTAIAKWAERDHDTIDRIFRRSGLYRDKWDAMRGTTTYGDRTIARACAAVHQTIREYIAEERRKDAEEFKQGYLDGDD